MNKKSVVIILMEFIFIIIGIMFVNSNAIHYLPQCWIYQNTGILCPACGGTRCVINLLQGNLKEAFFSHMIFFLTIIYLLICNVVYIINLNREKKIAQWIYPKYWYSIIFVVLLICYAILRNLL